MAHITFTNRTKTNISFSDHDKGDGNDHEIMFELAGYDISLILSDGSLEVVIDKFEKEKTD